MKSIEVWRIKSILAHTFWSNQGFIPTVMNRVPTSKYLFLLLKKLPACDALMPRFLRYLTKVEPLNVLAWNRIILYHLERNNVKICKSYVSSSQETPIDHEWLKRPKNAISDLLGKTASFWISPVRVGSGTCAASVAKMIKRSKSDKTCDPSIAFVCSPADRKHHQDRKKPCAVVFHSYSFLYKWSITGKIFYPLKFKLIPRKLLHLQTCSLKILMNSSAG